MKEKNEWWTLDNVLLVHGIFTGETKGDFEKDPKNPIPDQGEIACSITSPLTQTAFASNGVVLKPTTPVRFSYQDLGSYFEKGSDERTDERKYRGKVWTPDQLGLKELMYLTLAVGCHNEVHVLTQNTGIIGVFSDYETVDEFIEKGVRAAQKVDSDNPHIAVAQSMCTAASKAEFYVQKLRSSGNVQSIWDMSDKLKPGLEKLGYRIGHEIGAIVRLTDDLVSGKVSVEQLLGTVSPNEVYGGNFTRQPITKEHRNLLSLVSK